MFKRKGVRRQKIEGQRGDQGADELQRVLLRCGWGQQNVQELGRRKVIGTTQLQGLKYAQRVVGK